MTNYTSNVSLVTENPFANFAAICINLHFILMSYVEPVLSVLALIVNFLVIGIFCQKAASASLGPNVRLYYVAMAAFDIASVIVVRLIISFISYGIQYITGGRVEANLSHQNDLSCKLSYYFYNVSEQCSSFTFVLFSIERACALYIPLKARAMFTYRRVKIVSGFLYLVIVAFNVNILVSVQYVFTSYSDCRPGFGPLGSLFYFTVGDVNYGIPFLLILLINCMTVARVRLAARHRMVMAAKADSNENSSKEKSALSTVLLLSAAHCVIFFPLSVLQFFNSLMFSFLVPVDPVFAFGFDQLSWFTFHYACLGKIVNIFIYYNKVPFFKKKCRRLLCLKN